MDSVNVTAANPFLPLLWASKLNNSIPRGVNVNVSTVDSMGIPGFTWSNSNNLVLTTTHTTVSSSTPTVPSSTPSLASTIKLNGTDSLQIQNNLLINSKLFGSNDDQTKFLQKLASQSGNLIFPML